VRLSNGKRHVLVAMLICTGLVVQCHQLARPNVTTHVPVSIEPAVPAALASHSPATGSIEQMARTDPLAFLLHCRDNYRKSVQDYRCTFTKQERIGNRITPEQVTEVKFREQPYSVNMKWTHNPGDAAQVAYIAGSEVSDKGEEMAWCEPAGAIARLFVTKIRQPIHGKRADKASRRTIDQFGFANTLDLIIQYSQKAAAEGVLDLRYIGRGSIDGRPTYVFERVLPYTGQEEPYPDRLLVFHIDQEWLLPTGCFSYADDGAQDLLGKYLLTAPTFNIGFTDADFSPDSLGG
jgi:hypothetical protein